MSKLLIVLDDTTAVDYEFVVGLTSDQYDGKDVTRIYLEGRVDPLRVTMSLMDVLEKFQAALEPVPYKFATPYATSTGSAQSVGGAAVHTNHPVSDAEYAARHPRLKS